MNFLKFYNIKNIFNFFNEKFLHKQLVSRRKD